MATKSSPMKSFSLSISLVAEATASAPKVDSGLMVVISAPMTIDEMTRVGSPPTVATSFEDVGIKVGITTPLELETVDISEAVKDMIGDTVVSFIKVDRPFVRQSIPPA